MTEKKEQTEVLKALTQETADVLAAGIKKKKIKCAYIVIAAAEDGISDVDILVHSNLSNYGIKGLLQMTSEHYKDTEKDGS